jgi:hypothetical protein
MQCRAYVGLALFGALPFCSMPARADDAAVTAIASGSRRPQPDHLRFPGTNGLSDSKPIGPDTLFDIGALRDRAALSKAPNSKILLSEPGPIRRIPVKLRQGGSDG